MDPGNWSTDIAGGSAYGYTLLFIISLSALIAMFLQLLAAKVGLVTRRDLAQALRDSYSDRIRIPLWLIMEVAIMATDVAEVIGSAIAMKLLFGLPLVYGICITAADVLIFLLVGTKMRSIEGVVAVLVAIITVSFGDFPSILLSSIPRFTSSFPYSLSSPHSEPCKWDSLIPPRASCYWASFPLQRSSKTAGHCI